MEPQKNIEEEDQKTPCARAEKAVIESEDDTEDPIISFRQSWHDSLVYVAAAGPYPLSVDLDFLNFESVNDTVNAMAIDNCYLVSLTMLLVTCSCDFIHACNGNHLLCASPLYNVNLQSHHSHFLLSPPGT